MGESKLTVILDAQETVVLRQLAEKNLRDPRNHVRALIREEAARQGIKLEDLKPQTDLHGMLGRVTL